MELSVRDAAAAWLASGGTDAAHASPRYLRVSASGDVVEAAAPVLERVSAPGLCVRGVRLLKDGRTAAAVAAADSGDSAVLTLLADTAGTWRVVAAVLKEGEGGTKPAGAVLPADVSAVASACWDGYVAANRACDGVAMAQVFHPHCRLTCVKDGDDDDDLVVDQPDFIAMVAERYTRPMHAPYAHLAGDERVGAGDTLRGVEFAAPGIALVDLSVAHPPCLWHDLLTCARLSDGRWWILAKTSCHDPWLADEARQP